jgi:Protein  of unknown function (DUF3018)
LRKKALRPVQIWVPDGRSPAFRARRIGSALPWLGNPHADEDQHFIDATSDLQECCDD